MPQALVPIISAIGSSIGGVAGAALIMNAGAIALGAAIIGSATLKGQKMSLVNWRLPCFTQSTHRTA